jgi:hypothetical protein
VPSTEGIRVADAAAEIQTIIDNAQNRAGQAFVETLGWIQQTANAIRELTPVLDIPQTQEPPDFTRPDDPSQPPDFSHTPISRAARPEFPELEDVYVPDLHGLTLSAKPGALRSGLFEHDQPSPLGKSAPSNPPDVSADLPTVDAPVIDPRSPPSLTEIPTPVLPGPILIPGFQGIRPTDIGPETHDYAAVMEQQYLSIHPQMRALIDSAVSEWIDTYAPMDRESLSALEDRLQTYLAGGTALTPEVEQGIYDRGRAKLEAEQVRPGMEAIRAASRRGHELPSPVFFASQQRLAQAIADANGRAAIDIATKMAEMEQQNLQFAVTAAKDLRVAIRNVAVQYAGVIANVNGQALDFAKSVVSALRDAREAAIKYFDALAGLYQTDAAVYEAIIKGALADITRLEAETRIAVAIGQLDETKAKLFQSQIDDDRAIVQLYGERLQAIGYELQRRKLLLDQFLALVQGFEAEVRAKLAETEVFKALMSGDESIVNAWVAEWNGWRAEAEALLKKGDLEIQKSTAIGEANKNIIAAFDGELRAFLGDIELEKVYSQEDLDVFRARIEKYREELQRQIAIATTNRDYDRLKVERSKYDLDAKVAVASQQANLNLGAQAHRVQGLENIAQVAGQLAGAYANAIQSLVNLASEDITTS